MSLREINPSIIKSISKTEVQVMPNRSVHEELELEKVLISDKFIRGEFKHRYNSEMARSPKHLTVIGIPVQTQKLFYIWACDYLMLDLDLQGNEKVKIWPTDVNIEIPDRLCDDRHTQDILVEEFNLLAPDKYFFRIKSVVNDSMKLSSSGYLYIV